MLNYTLQVCFYVGFYVVFCFDVDVKTFPLSVRDNLMSFQLAKRTRRFEREIGELKGLIKAGCIEVWREHSMKVARDSGPRQ